MKAVDGIAEKIGREKTLNIVSRRRNLFDTLPYLRSSYKELS